MQCVVITDCDHLSTEIEERVFSAAHISMRRAACRTEDDVIEAGRDADGLLTQHAPVTSRVLEALPRCAAVGRYGVGVDTIDVAAAARLGVGVVSVPDYATAEVSDHAVALVLALTRGVVAADRAVRQGDWGLDFTPRLRRTSGLCVGVLGLGRIGRAVADKLTALGFIVVGHDPAVAAGATSTAVTLESLLAESDVISLHLPLTDQTRHLVDAAMIERMRPGALLVNTARGGIVDEQALTHALESGRLGGAALDVLAVEPPAPSSPLLTMPTVVLTPHIAFYSRESLEDLKRRAAEGMVDALRCG